MPENKRYGIMLIAGLLSVFIISLSSSCNSQTITGESVKAPLKIGAILPLTTPAAVFGVQIQNGMELAKQELFSKGVMIDITYEDSEANPVKAVTAYHKLVDSDRPNIIFSAYSRASVPLIALADADKIPLMMTIVSAKGVADQSPYAFRFYTNERQYVEPHFGWMTNVTYDSVALLTLNDEFGTSVREVIQEECAKAGIKIVAQEQFEANTVDFRAQLSKIESVNPKAIIIVASVVPEISNAIRQALELGINADLIEASAALSQPAAREALGSMAEGAYTVTFPFSLNKTGMDFSKKYNSVFGTSPNLGASFGYDMVMLSATASKGQALSGYALASAIMSLQEYESLNGLVKIKPNGEINPPIYSVKVVNGGLQEVG